MDDNNNLTSPVNTSNTYSSLDSLRHKLNDVSDALTTKANKTVSNCLNKTADMLTAAISGFTDKIAEAIKEVVQVSPSEQNQALTRQLSETTMQKHQEAPIVVETELPLKKVSLAKSKLTHSSEGSNDGSQI